MLQAKWCHKWLTLVMACADEMQATKKWAAIFKLDKVQARPARTTRQR